MRGGDLNHLNRKLWEPWYKVRKISGERKPWHAGSASFAEMFPEHILIGDKFNGGIVFSLPKGEFRWKKEEGIRGAQLAGEFLIFLEKPEKAIAFSVDPINRNDYFYDTESFKREYLSAMHDICNRYSLDCPTEPIDVHNWKNKRFAFVISLVSSWYNAKTNMAYDNIWKNADNALQKFYEIQSIIEGDMEERVVTPSKTL